MKKLLYIFVIALFLGCSHYVRNAAGYVRPPKDYKFPYRHRMARLADTSVIDTAAIYYLHDSNYMKANDAYKNGDAYIRFYNNGRFKLQGLKEGFPKIEDINNIDSGIIGYYIIQGNAVKMQVYGDINGGSNQLEYGYIDERKNLVVMHDNPRSDFNIGYTEKKIKRLIERSSFNPKVYVKIKPEGMTYKTPDW